MVTYEGYTLIIPKLPKDTVKSPKISIIDKSFTNKYLINVL